MVPGITAPTRAGQPAPAAGAPPPPRRNVMMDVKTLSGAAGLYGLYREGPHARSNRRGAPVACGGNGACVRRIPRVLHR